MNNTTQKARGRGYRAFHQLRKIFILLTLTCLTCTAFAQNVKPYTVDFSRMPAVNNDKTAAFDKSTKTITIKSSSGSRDLYLGLGGFDISNYNIIRIKYKALDDFGFYIHIVYSENSQDFETYYCHSYLPEITIPLNSIKKNLNGIAFQGAHQVTYERIKIESLTFEKVANPVLTDPWPTDESPVIDTASTGKFNDKISAWDFVKDMGVGINNTVFAQHDTGGPDYVMDFYNLWGYEKPTKKEIQFIKAKGFKTIRVCTEPGVHMMDKNYTVDPRFIKAIKQFVDWAIEEDMYVILCGPASNLIKEAKDKVENDVHYSAFYVSEGYKKKAEDYLLAVWKQYAAAFNNSYDEHLIFQFINEPSDVLHEHASSPDPNCSVCKKDYALLNEFNQHVLNTIRSTGGNNAKRFVMVDGLAWSRWQCITTNLFKLPKDKAKDKIIPSVHMYPMGSNVAEIKKYYTRTMKKEIEEAFAALDKYYFSKHIPVYFSELGHSRIIPILERINQAKDLMAEATKDKRSCSIAIWDDADDFKGGYENCYYDKKDLVWYDTEYIDSILYAAQGKDFPLSETFIKTNEVKVESIVGKNLLPKPVEINNWEPYIINAKIFQRSTPLKYKLEIQVQKNGSKPMINVSFNDINWKFQELLTMKNVHVTGGQKEGSNLIVKSDVITITIDEAISEKLETAQDFGINGNDIIVKSLRVVE